MTKSKNINRRVKIRPRLPTLDLNEFNILTDALFETLKENNAACARLLGINVRTWKRWEQEPPTWPYWNIVLRHALKTSISFLEGNRGISRAHKMKIINTLSSLPHEDPLLSAIEDLSYNYAASTAHLRRLLSRGGMYKDEIMKLKNRGGYSKTTIEAAAKVLEVVKTQEGFGTAKRSFWRLPDQDDD